MRAFSLAGLMALLAPTSGAAEVVTDAFGVLPQAGDPLRDAWSGLRVVIGDEARREERIEPEGPDQVLALLGEKTIVAGGAEAEMAAVVIDRHGNLVADGTQANFVFSSGLDAQDSTKDGIAAIIFEPGPVAGVYYAGVEVGGRQGARAEYRVTADLGSILPVISGPGSVLMPPESFGELSTVPLRDRYGNPPEGGVSMTAMISHEDGAVTLAPVATVQGQGVARLLTRDIPAEGSAVMRLGAATSEPQRIEVTSLVPAGPLEVTATALEDIDALLLRFGPFVTSEGWLLNDGASLSVEIEGANGAKDSFESWLQDGLLTELRLLSPDDLPLHVKVTSAMGVQEAVIERLSPPRPRPDAVLP